ncbi:hypothetical protein HKBW3S42_02072, partial [Candidatus Hakubella thermalkaliphila]
NGTYVNRERVEEAILKDKDELQYIPLSLFS